MTLMSPLKNALRSYYKAARSLSVDGTSDYESDFDDDIEVNITEVNRRSVMLTEWNELLLWERWQYLEMCGKMRSS